MKIIVYEKTLANNFSSVFIRPCDAFLLWAVFWIVFAISFLPIGTMIKKAMVSKPSFKIVLKIENRSNSNHKTSILFYPPLNLCPILLYPLSQLTKLGKSSSKYQKDCAKHLSCFAQSFS